MSTSATTSPPPPHPRAPRRRWPGQLRRLLVPAVLLAMLMLALEHTRALDVLDVLGLRLAAPVQLVQAQPRERVEFRLIDVDTYVRDFGGSSPLNPAVLAPWLQQQVPKKYGALMIDLQLEPWPGQSRDALDTWLRDQAAGGRLVLPVPQLGWTREVHERSYAWMKELCAAGAHFADPRLREHQGWVVRLDRLPHTLAQVTRELLPPPDDHHKGAADHHAAGATPICEAAQLLPDLDSLYAFLDADAQSVALHHTTPLRPGLVAALTAQSRAPREPGTATAECAACVIAVGGSYDANDRFRVPSLRQPAGGVIVHASGVMASDSIASSTPLNVGLDILLGVAIGALLAMREHGGRKRWIASGLIAVLVLAPLLLAGVLMNLGVWANPLPMLIGMWLHAKSEPLFHALGHWLQDLRQRPKSHTPRRNAA